jgi:transcriptional regulator with XRE-family HTH domain
MTLQVAVVGTDGIVLASYKKKRSARQRPSLSPRVWTSHPPRAGETVIIARAVAERANVHRTYISSIELGKVSMGIEIAHALVCALGLKLSELVRKAE